jgi:flagellar protein FliO/FliZ
MASGFTSLLSFLAVIAAIPLVLWLVKRGTTVGGTGSAGMRRVAMLPLSPSQKLVTVEVGSGDSRCWLVLGVTPNSISTLHTMLPQDEAVPSAPSPTPTTTFAQLLQRLQGRGPDAH